MKSILQQSFFALATLMLVLTSCATSRSYGDRYPDQLNKEIDFNMSLEEFHSIKGTTTSDMQDDSFRWIYVEKVSSSTMTDIVYYFDKDGDQPLYEMIFIYKDEASRDADADKLLGEPNEGDEWKLKLEPHTLTAWKFKNKLIMAAVIPNTEWAE